MAISAEKVLARRYGLTEADVTAAAAMTGKQAAQELGISKKVGNILAGSDALDIQVVFDAKTSGYADGFVFTWERADKPTPTGRAARTVTVDGGTTSTISGIPTGTSCWIVSMAPESAAPTNWHWGSTTYSPTDKEVKIVEGVNSKITVTPTIVGDEGSLEISVVLVDDDESGEVGPFTVSYTVNGGDPVEVEIDPGDSLVVDDLEHDDVIVVSASKPTPDPEGFVWLDPVLDPVDGEVTIVAGATPVEATVTFEIEASP